MLFAACLLLACLCVSAQHPYAVGSFPHDRSVNLPCNTFISVQLHFPQDGRQPDPATINALTVRVYPEAGGRAVPSRLEYQSAMKYLTLTPMESLKPYTSYIFELSSNVSDDRGAGFMPYKIRFTTGPCAGDSLPPVAAKPQPDSVELIPPRLLGLKTLWSGDTLLLHWEVAHEPPDAEYMLERADENGGFQALSYLRPLADTAHFPGRYSCADPYPPAGPVRYRITMRSQLAASLLSDSARVFRTDIRFMNTNIAAGENLEIAFYVAEKTTLAFVLKNAAGEIVRRKAGFVAPGRTTSEIPLQGVSPGAYLAILRTAERTVAQRIEIQ
jgi:Bacterial Ig-like domain